MDIPTGVTSEDATVRLAMIQAELPGGVHDAVFAPGASNDIWISEHSVLRVCWRGNTERLAIEAELGNDLPAAIGYPRTTAWGRRGNLVWQVQTKVDAVAWDQAWSHHSKDSLRQMVSQLAAIYRSLHEWDVPPHARQLLEHKSAMQRDDPRTHLVPLPVEFAYSVLEEIAGLRWFPADLYRTTLRRLDDLSQLDPFQSQTEQGRLIHCDASPANIMEREGRIVSLLDFEWARLGPIDMELLIWLHMARAADVASMPFPPILRWLKADYPELFIEPDSRERLWLYHLLFTIHGVAIWHPDAPEDTLTPDHHVHTLRKLTDQPLIPD